MTLSDFRLRLVPQEATQLLAELEALVGLLSAGRLRRPGAAGTERVVLQIQLLPFVRSEPGERGEAVGRER